MDYLNIPAEDEIHMRRVQEDLEKTQDPLPYPSGSKMPGMGWFRSYIPQNIKVSSARGLKNTVKSVWKRETLRMIRF